MTDTPIQHVSGSQAIAIAAVHAGCRFVAAYPTDSTAVLLSDIERFASDNNVTILKTGDEPAAMSGCIDASADGAPALTMTASPRLGILAEKIGIAHLNEIPMVLVHCQSLACAGPIDDDGYGEYDMALARHLGFGSVCLPVLACTDIPSCYRLTNDAFRVAECLRTPVILLTTKERMDSKESIRLDDIPLTPIEDRPDASIDPADSQTRITRLLRKITDNREFLELVQADADPDAETLLISYGLADQAARRAVASVRKAGARVSHLTIHSLWPIPEGAIRRAITPFVRRVLVPELNTGLYADALSRVIRAVQIESIARYDGQLIEPEAIARRITDWPCG